MLLGSTRWDGKVQEDTEELLVSLFVSLERYPVPTLPDTPDHQVYQRDGSSNASRSESFAHL
jgi:hypothetical protein